ncbi:hypothetical protein BZA05DRAFT_446959 [Tricharina praecox]|uniref:uncharacterized protein n=1 Tax=Tricharina praecox TaxID=43433 RepID=UPI00221E60EC|nr:uncharacterized protein BZA05DRAFT_446959 [Tricharina praecox]KAI5847472.1 hypothetical protein BZA05DRAFT_446959 [Tricharina praecox]
MPTVLLYSSIMLRRLFSTHPHLPFSNTLFSMVKDKSTVISEFNDLVNMTPAALEQWLHTSASTGAGWHKDGDGDGETVGHERQVPKCGRHIVDILQRNPSRDPSKYGEDDIAHMRKVVSYCKRHLAQEEAAKQNTESKSYKSLKNWGHDAQLE